MAEENENETLSENDKKELSELLGYGGQTPDGKHNVHTFLHNVVKADDTLRLGNLSVIELGNLEQPVRALQEVSLFSKSVMNNDELAKYFTAESEIVTRSSLSKGGFLINTSVTNKKELADTTPQKPRKENPSWFKKKNKSTDEVTTDA
jgi:hypothetical protein